MLPPLNRLYRLLAAMAIILGFAEYAIGQPALAPARSAFDREDYAAAYRLYSPAAEAGMAEAQYRVGLMHKFGWGTERNHATAARWFTAAAEQSHPEAQSELAIYYKDGRGVEKDLARAADWFRKAAEQGVGIAQLNLGRFYLAGSGVERDPAAAYLWLTAAARNNYADGIALRVPAAKQLSEEQIRDAEARASRYVARPPERSP